TSYEQCGNQGRPRRYVVAGLEPRLSVSLGSSGSTLVAGMRVYAEDVRRRQYTGNQPFSREGDATLARDNEIESLALAAFSRLDIGLGALTVSPGLRLERVSQLMSNRFPGSEANVRQEYTELMPGIGATVQAGQGTTLFAGVHRGFAPPRPSDVYSPEPDRKSVGKG